MTFQLLAAVAALASLLGTWLNVKKRRSCFYVWGVTNLAWVGIDAYAGVWPQAALHACYAGLAVYGLREWRRKATEYGAQR